MGFIKSDFCRLKIMSYRRDVRSTCFI